MLIQFDHHADAIAHGAGDDTAEEMAKFYLPCEAIANFIAFASDEGEVALSRMSARNLIAWLARASSIVHIPVGLIDRMGDAMAEDESLTLAGKLLDEMRAHIRAVGAAL